MPSAAGSPDVTLRSALRKLSAAGAREVISSRFFATPCFPPGAGPDYVNAAAGLTFDGGPEDLLAVLHGIEADFGRERVQRVPGRLLYVRGRQRHAHDLRAVSARVPVRWHEQASPMPRWLFLGERGSFVLAMFAGHLLERASGQVRRVRGE